MKEIRGFRLYQRRGFAFTFTLLVSAGAAALFSTVLGADGVTLLDYVRVSILALSCLWLGWGAATALLGVFSSGKKSGAHNAASPRPAQLLGRTAILMPIYNEDAEEVFARVSVMAEELQLRGYAGAFDFHVLSDTTDSECQIREKASFECLHARRSLSVNIYYRHREKNIGRKAGNVAEFVRRSGGAYDYMLVLDADSLMTANAMVQMVARMDHDPELGLLQTLPLVIGQKTFWGRMLEYATCRYGPSYARGLAELQGRSGPFWGHNAIIRVRAFASSCGLPDLEGPKPFGGHILSHDSVEAALLIRNHWKVMVDPEIRGSFEGIPENMVSFAARDRRWCQGNMQHIKVVGANRLSFWSRFSLGLGIGAYLTSTLWAIFVLTGLLGALLAEEFKFFIEGSLFPQFPVPRGYEGIILLAGVAVLLLAPKFLMALRNMWFARTISEAIGVFVGFWSELICSALFAPIHMAYQTRAVLEVFSGRDSGWTTAHRGNGSLTLSQAIKGSWWIALLGCGLLLISWFYAPSLWYWLLPIAGPQAIAPMLIWLSSQLVSARFMKVCGLVNDVNLQDGELLLERVHVQMSESPHNEMAKTPFYLKDSIKI